MSPQSGIKAVIKSVLSTKSGFIGFLTLSIIVGVSVFALLYVPFDVVSKWNDPVFWQRNPRLAAPEWISEFNSINYPKTIRISQTEFNKYEYYVELSGLKYIILEARLNYEYDGFPSELYFVIYSEYSDQRPLATLTLIRPDEEEVIIFKNIIENPTSNIYISTDRDIRENIEDFLANLGANVSGTIYPEVTLFAQNNEYIANPTKASVLNGNYKIRLEMIASNETDTADAEFYMFGTIHGLAGTDNRRRDLFVGLVWGAPVALAFGLSAAIATSIIQSFLGALSAWYGGIVDEIVQRITEVYMILPFLPFLILVSIVYEINLLLLILIIILLSLFGGVTKTARSVTFQIMGEQYIEAAISYGASKIRILALYIIPRLLPYIVANIVLSVPAFVFLEASLSVLGLGDPMVPTWGKIISAAYSGGAVIHGYWWWILLPAILIMITAMSFAFIGYALDKVVNPKLRER
jgi:peptide/nickel transport system permease protein